MATALLEARSSLERIRENAESGEEDASLWAELCELGWPGIAISEEYGGQGLGLVELTVLLEQAGRTLASVPLLSTAVAALAIQTAGNDEQKERWVPGLAAGEITGAVGVAASGKADIAAGSQSASVAVLFDEEGGARIVDLADALAEPLETIDPTRRYLTIEGPGVELPGDSGSAYDRAITALAAELTGVASRAMEMSVAYVKDRKQFDMPIAMFQAVGHRQADAYIDTEAIRLTTQQALWRLAAGVPATAEVAAAKFWAAWGGQRVVHAAQHLHGGVGVDRDYPLHRCFLQAKEIELQLGGSTRQLLTLGKLIAATPV
jgi:alkylation response protein AidB-like acyl-CoA dehydrogenase